ncbi:hypothetical protein LCL89_06425 [Halobacillus yeomjeoni]|nr:hypothetical protein [Halobacillus yeomjeoni]MCA0983691.1 hypothetical protein [Halobacillus yeomjeoni]
MTLNFLIFTVRVKKHRRPKHATEIGYHPSVKEKHLDRKTKSIHFM